MENRAAAFRSLLDRERPRIEDWHVLGVTALRALQVGTEHPAVQLAPFAYKA
jgi:hypothetical protein